MRQLVSVATAGYAMADGDVIEPEDLPAQIQMSVATTRADSLFERVTRGGEDFWEVVHKPFMERELNRDQVREVVRKGLDSTRGSYQRLLVCCACRRRTTSASWTSCGTTGSSPDTPPERMMPPQTEAIVFDLYGTLLRIGTPLVHKGIPRTLGVSSRPWMEMVRGELLVSRFSSPRELVRAVCERLAPSRPPQAEARCNELLERELASVEALPGVRALLAFLQRRGYALALISNLTSAHKEPLARLGLGELFSATAYSCDEGRCKPDPRIYLELCERLGVAPERVLVVGDSLANDVEAPRRLGMRALHVGAAAARARCGRSATWAGSRSRARRRAGACSARSGWTDSE